MPEFLLEVGFEEMPAPWLEDLGSQLLSTFGEAAGREFLEPRDARVFWTPRRLVLRADLLARQADREHPIWGPTRKVAKDSAGNWTKAAEGFAKKNDIAVEQLRFAVKGSEGVVGGKPAAGLTQPSEENLLHVRSVPGRPTLEVLPGVIGESLRALAFPKRMSWDAWLDDGRGAFPFGRPVRWLVSMLDGTVIPFVIYELVDGAKGKGRVASGPTTLGHRFLPKGAAGRAHIVQTHAELQDALRRNFVLLDPGEREKKIAGELESLAGGALSPDDHGLRAEWRDLVEYPTVVGGSIPTEFQALPREVLETVLVHHQKYFPLAGSDGRVVRFAAVTNTDGAAAAEMVRGMERVVVARLRDAAFFYTEDLKRPLRERVVDLSGVTFHKKLGTYQDKTARMVELVEQMALQGWLRPEDRALATEAARLAKADLTTLMVREFPELQGTIGGLYLSAHSAPEPVAKAVRWHYHPVSIEEGSAPAAAFAQESARVFAAVSMADKMDTLAGYFALQEGPTGSRDPFGLRRAAHGVIRLVLEFWKARPDEKRPNLVELTDEAMNPFRVLMPDRQPYQQVGPLLGFLQERLVHVLRTWGFPADEVSATTSERTPDALTDPFDALIRLRALNRVRSQAPDEFNALAVNFKRANNILRELGPTTSFPFNDGKEGLVEDAERELHSAIERWRATWSNNGDGSLAQADYERRLRSVAQLTGPVDRFFREVRVDVENQYLKQNRLFLLESMIKPIYRIADISKLGGQS